MKKVLVVSVHPDDETLGCGGTILKHKANKDALYWLIITAPTLEHPHGFTSERIEQRNKEIEIVSQMFGFEKVFNLGFPTQLLDELNFREIVVAINDVLSLIQPQIIYMINRSDIHSDHKVAFQAIYSCTKSFRKPYIEQILMYETLSETEFAPALPESAFIPNVFVDISDFMEEKLKIMQVFSSEVMQEPFPRSLSSIRALARTRGSRIGVHYAEAFMLLFDKR